MRNIVFYDVYNENKKLVATFTKESEAKIYAKKHGYTLKRDTRLSFDSIAECDRYEMEKIKIQKRRNKTKDSESEQGGLE